MQALIIDDDVDVLTIIREVLASNNFQSICSTSPLEALKIVEKQSFHIIITDILMPDMDGFELAQRLEDLGIKTPIIALTGLPNCGHEILTKNDGKRRKALDIVLTKPFDYIHFYKAIESISHLIDYKLTV